MSAFALGDLHFGGLNQIIDRMEAVEVSNQAFKLKQVGALDEAEEVNKQALAAKLATSGPKAITTAISYDSLGRVQLELGKLDEAEANFRKALEIRKDMAREEWDNSVTRENLAQVLEAKGDLKAAKQVRLMRGNDKVCCANYKCLIKCQFLPTLKNCAKCKCVYYCSSECQTEDWFARHKALCHAVS